MTATARGSAITQLRLKLAASGFSPLPVNGKKPLMPGWQKMLNVTDDQIRGWEHDWHGCPSTGILTRLTPTVDIDILHPEAAAAVEALVRERFEEHGRILVRFGLAPKRAILLRTNPDEAFRKLVRNFTDPTGKPHKIEVMADGQQIVAFGIHPDTRRPYSWHGGEPGDIKYEELPYVRKAEIRELLDDAAAILVEQFGFKDHGFAKDKADGNAGDDASDEQRERGDPLDWGKLCAAILAGENLHDSVRDLAAAFIGSGMSDKAAITQLQSLLTASIVEKDARWRERYADIPRAVRSAREKYQKGDDAEPGDGPYRFPRVYRYGEVDYRKSRCYLVQNVIPEICCGLISGQWGTFKTFVALYLAYCVMTGEPFLGYEINRRGAVLFIALEGVEEVSIRIRGIAIDRSNAEAELPFEWVDEIAPGGLLANGAIDNLCGAIEPIAKELEERHGVPLALIEIDTVIDAAGYNAEGQENDAAAGQVIMNVLAQVARRMRCAVFGVDHFGKDVSTGTRGTSAKEGRGDVVLACLGEKAVTGGVTNTRLALRKRRGGANGEEHPFTPRVVPMGEDDLGNLLSTLVLDFGPMQSPQTAESKEAGGKSAQLLRRVLMTILAEHGTEQTPFADGPTVRACDITLVRNEFFRQYVAEGTDEQKHAARKRAFNRSVQVAQKGGLINAREVEGTQWVWLIKPV